MQRKQVQRKVSFSTSSYQTVTIKQFTKQVNSIRNNHDGVQIKSVQINGRTCTIQFTRLENEAEYKKRMQKAVKAYKSKKVAFDKLKAELREVEKTMGKNPTTFAELEIPDSSRESREIDRVIDDLSNLIRDT